MSNDWTKEYQDGTALNEAQLDSGFSTIKPSLANTTTLTDGSTEGEVLRSNGSGNAAVFNKIDKVITDYSTDASAANTIIGNAEGMYEPYNYGLAASISSGALVVNLQGADGNAPSSTNEVIYPDRQNGSSESTLTRRKVTSAVSVTLPAATDLSFPNATGVATVYVYVYYDSDASSTALAVSRNPNRSVGQSEDIRDITDDPSNSNALYAEATGTAVPQLLGAIELTRGSSAWSSITEIRLTAKDDKNDNTLRASDRFTDSSSGSESTTVSLNITTKGRPVFISLTGNDTGNAGTITLSDSSGAISLDGLIRIKRNGTTISTQELRFAYGSLSGTSRLVTVPISMINHLDNPPAGQHTYTLTIDLVSGDNMSIDGNIKAYEL